MREYEIDRVEKFVLAPEIRMLNARIKHCTIHNYYTMGDALIVCTACMIRIADINDVGMYHIREHETGSFGRLSASRARIERQRTFVQYILVQHVPTLHTLKKNYCEQYWKICGKTIM